MNLPIMPWVDPVETRAQGVVIPNDAIHTPYDQIFRISLDHLTQTALMQSWNTSDLSKLIADWAQSKQHDIQLLKSFAAWQKKKLEFQAVYNAFLLEAISEDEFTEEAEAFAIEPKHPDPRLVGETLDRLVELLPFEVSTSEFADFFECDTQEVLTAIERSSVDPRLHALLPSPNIEEEDE